MQLYEQAEPTIRPWCGVIAEIYSKVEEKREKKAKHRIASTVGYHLCKKGGENIFKRKKEM